MRRAAPLLAAWLVLSGSATAQTAVYPELADGESQIWTDLGGVGHWFTARAPLADTTPFAVGLGYGHRIGNARLAWRLHFLGRPWSDDLAFIYGDLLSVEQVFLVDTAFRPFWRVALGFGLDLVGDEVGLGSSGYFNPANGASGGIGLAHGWGFDWMLGGDVFLRVSADLRLYGGAGRVGLLGAAEGGVGYTF